MGPGPPGPVKGLFILTDGSNTIFGGGWMSSSQDGAQRPSVEMVGESEGWQGLLCFDFPTHPVARAGNSLA
jgi:hypothetical protein